MRRLTDDELASVVAALFLLAMLGAILWSLVIWEQIESWRLNPLPEPEDPREILLDTMSSISDSILGFWQEAESSLGYYAEQQRILDSVSSVNRSH